LLSIWFLLPLAREEARSDSGIVYRTTLLHIAYFEWRDERRRDDNVATSDVRISDCPDDVMEVLATCPTSRERALGAMVDAFVPGLDDARLIPSLIGRVRRLADEPPDDPAEMARALGGLAWVAERNGALIRPSGGVAPALIPWPWRVALAAPVGRYNTRERVVRFEGRTVPIAELARDLESWLEANRERFTTLALRRDRR
jgi:hypothetical protein